MSENERTIVLDERDCRRLKKIQDSLKEVSDIWQASLRLMLPDYLDGETNKKVDIIDFDFDKREIKVRLS